MQQRMITSLAATSSASLPQLANDAVAAETAAQAASSQAAAARRFAQASASGDTFWRRSSPVLEARVSFFSFESQA